MKCPECSHDDTKVLESRDSNEGRSIRRRRACIKCGFRFTTYEKEEELPLQVAKRNGVYEPFSREKLIRAIQAACIKRPVSLNDIEPVVARIEKKLLDAGDRVISSLKIGDLTVEELKALDHVAYVRFASIYKDFKDPEAFRAELESLSVSSLNNDEPAREL